MPKAPHVVITGGASYASPDIAKKFKDEGYRVTLMGKNLTELDAIADQIKAYAIRIDLSDPASVETAFMQAGPVDVLVNCAVTVRPSQTLRTDIRVWEEHLKMNMTSAFLCSLKVLPSMIRRSKGCIINVPNYFGRVGGSHLGALSASMHGLIGFTRALAAEYDGQGIRINAVCPTHLDCPLTYEIAELLSTMDDGKSQDSYISDFKAQNPTGEFLSSQTVAEVIFRLSEETAADIHGQILNIDEEVNSLEACLSQNSLQG